MAWSLLRTLLARPRAVKPIPFPVRSPRSAWRREFEQLCRVRLEHRVAVKEPLVLISQVQRSGGTLLSQLFDAHPQCHAHPHELYIGQPNKWTWPALDLQAGPDAWFESLFEPPAARALAEGYHKSGLPLDGGEGEAERFPFIFLPSLQKIIFDHCAARAWNVRDIFDAYFTSYFNAWIDNRNLHGPKRIMTAFVPRLAMRPGNLERFFQAYPDGRLVSIVRNPCDWYVSARNHNVERHGRDYADIRSAIELWKASAEAIHEARSKYGSRVLVLHFEELLGDTAATMRRLARELGIDDSDTLLTPTFNGWPIRANSNFPVECDGVIQAPLRRHAQLSPEERRHIEDTTRDLELALSRLVHESTAA